MAKVVFLSAGHGGSDPGAVANGVQEKTANLNTLLACKEILEQAGVTVVCSRTTDANDPVQEEVREANASRADVAVSFHHNAGGGDGFEAYYYGGDPLGIDLAQALEKAAVSVGQNTRGIKNGSHLMFINSTNMTAALVESAFLDSLDVKLVDTVAKQQLFGRAYGRAILEYLGIKQTPAVKPAEPEPAAAEPPHYHALSDIPLWAYDDIKRLCDDGVLKDRENIALDYDGIRYAVMIARTLRNTEDKLTALEHAINQKFDELLKGAN